MRVLVEDLNTEAANYVSTAFPTVGRDRVSTYRNFLWIWHRLNETRWKVSQVQLRIGKRAPDWDVDHTVAYSLWQDKLTSGFPSGIEDEEDALAVVNRLGNCVLLEKNFNISKSKQSAASFLTKVHEFQSGAMTLDDWSSALSISSEMLDPTTPSVTSIKEAIDKRDKDMRDELAEFARGKRDPADLDSEPLAVVAPALA